MKKLFLFAWLMLNELLSMAQYCTPHTTNIYSHHQIQYFQFDSLINITSNVNPQEYNDFSGSQVIKTKLGGNHYILLSIGQNPFSFMAGNYVGYSVWIDFNHDLNFANSEMVYSKYSNTRPDCYTVQDTFTFPALATTGIHRLRVRSEWGRAPDLACDYLWGGETEDYTINIAPGHTTLGVSERGPEPKLVFYPNPSSDNFTLDLKDPYNRVEVKISDITGKIIKVHTFNNSSQIKFNISDGPGIYFASVNLGNYSKVFKLVKH